MLLWWNYRHASVNEKCQKACRCKSCWECGFPIFWNYYVKKFTVGKGVAISPMNMEKLMWDNRVLLEALRLAAFSVADEQDPTGTNKMHQWIEQAQKNLA